MHIKGSRKQHSNTNDKNRAKTPVILTEPPGPDLPPHVRCAPVPGAVAGVHVVHQDDGEPDQVQGQDGRDVEERRGAGVRVDHLRGCASEMISAYLLFKRF